MSHSFSSIPEAVDAIARGEVIIVIDDEHRENEGDYICAAELATPEMMNLVMSGRGDFCMPILPEAAGPYFCRHRNYGQGACHLRSCSGGPDVRA
jgi:3,4-dihydroxy 2-butanone 4-phosphate synthase/GTP cyclohydrolase II